MRKIEKKLTVYLTKKGEGAYEAHHAFHMENDREIFDYLEKCDEIELFAIKEFLDKANKMTGNHM